MSNLWIILCVLFSYSQTDSQTIHIVEHKSDWFTASQTCTRQQGRLPSVNIYDHRLQLKDLSDTKNISSPFWIAATYDNMSYNHCEPHYDLCPDTLCQTIAMSSGNIHIEWRPCWECNNFSCAYSIIEIYQEVDWKWECKDWTDAFQYCKERNARLATRENALFLKRVTNSSKAFWLDDMPQSNPAPDIIMENRTCLYCFNGTVHEGNCSDTSITTVCIREKITSMTHTNPTMFPSQPVFITSRIQTAEYSITNKPVITLSTNRMNTSHSSMLDSSEKPTEITSKELTNGMWPIIGSALGGLVVIIIIVLIIIIVRRIRRMKNDPEIAFNSDANNKPATKNMSQTQNEYDTVLGESFVLESTIATSTRVSNTQEEEPVICVPPQKVMTTCPNPIDVPFSIKQPTDENENTGLYSVVQKGNKTESIPNTSVNDDVHDKDYYDISFTETGKEKSVENVYNKANFDHSGRDEDQTVNMYDKANFSHDSLENNTGNDYDESNFYHKILEQNTGNDYDESNFYHKILEK